MTKKTTPPTALPFEKPIAELQNKLHELESFSESQQIDVSAEIAKMREKIEETRLDIYRNLTPWQKVQVARHPQRPYPKDYIDMICNDFTELHGDRNYADDRAIIGGFAHIDGRKVMIVATQKGRDTKSNLACNFGCPYPEGYRKALRLLKLAAKFNIPVITLIDTPGAFPGLESEERHIAEAIAVNLRDASVLEIPMLCVVTGEGGSGGALGIGIGDRLLILEHAYYSVISPEGCAAILWKDRAYADKAAEALKITSAELKSMGLVDDVVEEPHGGAHTAPEKAAASLKAALLKHMAEIEQIDPKELVEQRYDKIRKVGTYSEPATA